jgi:hypothetical protein
MDSITNKDKNCLLFKDMYEKEFKRLRRWTIKCCNALVKTQNGTVVKEIGDHIHSETVTNHSTAALRLACKRKATEDISTSIKDYSFNYIESDGTIYVEDSVLEILLTVEQHCTDNAGNSTVRCQGTVRDNSNTARDAHDNT